MSKKKPDKPKKAPEKPAKDLTTDEAIDKLFPRPAIDAARRKVFESDSRQISTEKD